MATDVFGLTSDETGETDVFADAPVVEDTEPPDEQTTLDVEVETETPEVETPEAPETALDEAEGEPAAGEAEAEVEAEGEPEAEPERKFAGKYATPEELEKGYNELRDLQRRDAEEKRKYEEYLRVAAQEIQRLQAPAAQAPAAPTATEIERAAADLGVDPETYVAAQKIAQEQIERQLAPFQQQQAAQQQQAMQQAAHNQELEAVRQVAVAWVTDQGDALTDETWNNVVQVFGELELDEKLPENYDLAREAAENPMFRMALKAVPDRVETVEGIDEARRLASLATTQPTPRRPRPNAHVERGGSGAAPAGDSPTTPEPGSWEAVVAAAAADRKKSSVLGV